MHRAARGLVAYQQAYALAKNLIGEVNGRSSLDAVGSLMGNLFGTVMVEGLLARLTYLSLYRKHQLALHGLRWVIMSVVARLFMRGTQPELKLHQSPFSSEASSRSVLFFECAMPLRKN